MDLRQQEYFISIVEEGSLSGAAQKLFVSQPTLSQFLNRLEQEEKTPLMKRGRNNTLTLTDAGQLYYESAKKMLQIRTDYMHRLSDLIDDSEKRLIFGVTAERGMALFMQITRRLHERDRSYESKYLLSRQNPAYKQQELVANCEIDAAFSAYKQKKPQLSYIDFSPAELVIVLPKDHPLAALGSTNPLENLPHLPLKQFESLPVATLHKHTVLRDILDDYCEENDVWPTIRFEVDQISNVLTIVGTGMAAGICTHNRFLNMQEDFSFIGMDPPLFYSTAVYYNKSAYQTRFLQDFLSIAREIALENTEEGKTDAAP